MASILNRNLPIRAIFSSFSKPSPGHAINLAQTANVWVGSYRIRDPDRYMNVFPKPNRWPRYNEIIQPPQLDPKEEPRPATYYHYRDNIKQSPKKMWHVCKFMRGLSIDEAIKQLKFMPLKGAQLAAQTLIEAQDIAVKKHNFKFKSEMWIEDVRCTKGLVIKGLRKHARMRYGEVRYFYSHLQIKLCEGKPPKHFYAPQKDSFDLLDDYYEKLRSRKIKMGL